MARKYSDCQDGGSGREAATQATTLILAEVASSMLPIARLRDHRGMTQYEGIEAGTELLRVTPFRMGQLRESRTRPLRPITDESEGVTLLPLLRLGRGALALVLLLPQIWWLRGYIQRTVHRPAIYLLSYHVSPVGLLLSHILPGAPVVLRQQVEVPQTGLGRRLNLAALRRADLILAVSEGIRRQIAAIGVDPLRVVVRHPAMNPCFLRAPKASRTGTNVRTVAFVGRLEREKGPFAAISAFEICAKDHSQLHLEVIGSGSLENKVKARLRQSPYRDRMLWIPKLDQDALARRLERIDVVLMPSENEGFGRVAVESILSGCVIVGYKTGGLPEACGPGGLLVEPPSVDGLALALNGLIADPGVLQSLRTRGSQHAQEVVHASATPVTALIRRTGQRQPPRTRSLFRRQF